MNEIELAPESLVQEAYDFILFLKSRRSQTNQSEGITPPPVTVRPDFLARQKALFGSRMVTDSQAILDEMRMERF